MLRRSGLIGALRLVRQLLDGRRRAETLGELRRLRRLRRDLGGSLARPSRPPEQRVLVVGLASLREITLQIPLITAFRSAGYRPVVVLDSRARIIQAAYRAIGVDRFAFYEDHLPARPGAPDITPDTTLEELLGLAHQGVTIGRYAISRLMRWTRNGDPDIAGRHRGTARAAIAEAMAYAEAARAIVATHRPDAALFLDHGYSPDGQLFDLVLDGGGACYTWNAAHRDGMLMLKRYGPESRNVHPSSLSPSTWRRLRDMRWSDRHWETLRREIEECYVSGEWYGEVGTQYRKRFPEPGALKVELGLDPGKKTAVIFPHIFWDATFFWGVDHFRNYEEWFVETLKAACRNDRLNWIVKIHPGNLVKDRRDGFQGEHSEITAIREAVGELPPHVRLIDASADIGSLSLYHVLDYCVTVRGTVGIEAAAFGKRVITAGTGRYDRLGFTEDPDSAEAYLDILSRLETLAPPDAAETELARRYAYGVFIARPTPLNSVAFAYAQDSAASLNVDLRARGGALWAADDVAAMAGWIAGGEADFLREGALADPVNGGA